MLDWTGRISLVAANPSFTGFWDEEIIGCAGVTPVWHGRAIAWALISIHAGPARMLAIHRDVGEFLDDVQRRPEFRRIEATCAREFTAARRWVIMLGFQHEGLMRRYDAQGVDHDLYARVR